MSYVVIEYSKQETTYCILVDGYLQLIFRGKARVCWDVVRCGGEKHSIKDEELLADVVETLWGCENDEDSKLALTLCKGTHRFPFQ